MWRIPLSDLNYTEDETRAVIQVLESGWLTMGPRTAEFETRFAETLGYTHAIAVANCTSALELACRYALQRAGKRRIVVPDITFVATANAVIAAGGEPILCDIESPGQPYISRAQLELLLDSSEDIAAVALVHYAGFDANAHAIAHLCRQYDILLIEDCAHATGAKSPDGTPLGSFGLAGCFSFFSNKNLSTGEGGMITTADAEFAQWLRLARSHGLTTGTWDRHKAGNISGYDVQFPGHNHRCTEITAALGLAQLSKLEPGNRARRRLTGLYKEYLAASPLAIIAPPANELVFAACHILSLLCESTLQRNAIRDALTATSIQTSHHYAPIHSFTWYQKNLLAKAVQFPHAEAFASLQITLPLYPTLPDSAVAEICDIILKSL